MRPLFILAGLSLCALVWFVPLTGLGLGPFSAHMVRHMTLVALAAPLLALAFPRLLAAFPVSPLIASAFEFVVVWGWHLPALHDAARASIAIQAAEQAAFLAAGIMLWMSVLKPAGQLAGAGGLLLTSMHMTLLGAILILSPRLLYHPGTASMLADQQLGGMIMLAIGTPVYLIAGLILVSRVLRDDSPAWEKPV